MSEIKVKKREVQNDKLIMMRDCTLSPKKPENVVVKLLIKCYSIIHASIFPFIISF